MRPLTPEKQQMVEELVPAIHVIARALNMRDDVDVGYLAVVRAAAVWDDQGRTHGDTTFRKFALQCARFAFLRQRKREYRQRHAQLHDIPVRDRSDIIQLIDTLSDYDKKIFLARFAMRHSVKTISICMRVSPRSVLASLARSIDALSEAMEV